MDKRVILIVLDSVGIGAMPDAHLFNDEGSNTLKNTAREVGGLNLPNLQKMGLGNLDDIKGVAKTDEAIASFGRMQEKSNGKDTTTGHWEFMGIILDRPFPTYPEGFPEQVIKKFEQLIGRKTLGNKTASGTVIIEELGKEHMATGYPIVYTSADSVFQIAAHEEVIPLSMLYEMCQTARKMLIGEHNVGRVIARPFVGEPGSFKRTANRHDYSLEPPDNILDDIVASGLKVTGVGKINDIFAGKGISQSYPTKSNLQGIETILQLMEQEVSGLIFANLVDFDQLYGHRNNPQGYAQALEEFDQRLSQILERIRPGDMLIMTADHGCDPTTESTDHSREYVPLLVYGPEIKSNINLGIRETFAEVGLAAAEHLGIKTSSFKGKNFYSLVRC